MSNQGLIINFTPTGMIPTKEMTPFVPISVTEIIEDVHGAVEIGSMMTSSRLRELLNLEKGSGHYGLK